MSVRPVALLLLLGGLLFFLALGNHQLQGSTEPRVAGIAMEMHLDNDWVTPRLNGMPFLEKPPLSLWLDATAIKWFGATPWAVRLASAVAGLLSLVVVYRMLVGFGRPRTVAWTAAIFMATMASYWSNVRQVGEDSLLTLGVTLGLLAFFQASRQRADGADRPWACWLLFALGIAIATLSKGVLGLALIGVVIFAYLVAESLIEKRFHIYDWTWPALITLLGLVPLMLWLYLLYQRSGSDAVTAVLWSNSVGRFGGSFEDAGHFEPFYYYLAKLPQAFLPWNILVYLGLWHFRRQLLANRYRLFFSLWLLAQFTLLTLASSKRMVYLMGLTPAAAVIAAEYATQLLDRLRERAVTSTRAQGWLRYQRPLIAGGLAAIICSYLAVALWVLPAADQEESFLPLTAEIRALQADGHTVALFNPSERLAGAGVFYSESLLAVLPTPAALTGFLTSTANSVAVMESQVEPAAPLRIRSKILVGARAYYFVTQ